MKKLIKVAILGSVLGLNALDVNALTVFYKPTPYPFLKKDGTSMPQDIKIVHTWQGWFGSFYNKTLVQNDFIQIGGWGDAYYSLMRFDLDGLPSAVDAVYLYLYALPSGSANPSQMSMYKITSAWDPSTVGANNFPSNLGGFAWSVSSSVNNYRFYSLKTWYDGWKAGTYPNYGMILVPYNNDGTQRFDKFVSTRSTDASHRPFLALSFVPSLTLKMPFAGGSWQVTTEVGGYDCLGVQPYWPDIYHQGSNYFSIDFGGAEGSSILAAGSGKVIETGGSIDGPNGYFITIDHDGDGKNTTGFQTKYLHLQGLPAKKDGTLLATNDYVVMGDQIGKMGKTGASTTGTHLHFGVKYQNSGSLSSNQLAKVVMDGKLLKSYQTECSLNTKGVPLSLSPSATYTSTNYSTGK